MQVEMEVKAEKGYNVLKVVLAVALDIACKFDIRDQWPFNRKIRQYIRTLVLGAEFLRAFKTF